jgi:regulator of nonsense transcripts 3
MSTSPSRPKAPPTKPKKERERERERERKEKALQQSTERLKTVVRRLPPNLPEDVFWQSVQPWVTEEAVSWKVFYAGKARKRYALLTLHSLPQSLIWELR